jgi:pyruvate kinase
MAAAAPRRTKIVATVGPASDSVDSLRALVDAGADAARLNLSHGSHEDHAARAQMVRDVQDAVGRPLALIGDLQGPKIRVGRLNAPIPVPSGGEVTVVYSDHAPDGELPIAPAVVGEVLQPGHDVLIDDGLVRLHVEEVASGRARCSVVVGGVVGSHKGVNLPGVQVPIP